MVKTKKMAHEQDQGIQKPTIEELTSILSGETSGMYDRYNIKPYNPDEVARSKCVLSIYQEMRED